MFTKDFFLYGFLINYAVLMWWFLWVWLKWDMVMAIHQRFFDLTENQYHAIHYAAMAFYKLLIIMFFLTPYLILEFL
jgi:signal transduction histidine kinase